MKNINILKSTIFHTRIFNILSFVCFLGIAGIFKLFFLETDTNGLNEFNPVSTAANILIYVIAVIYVFSYGSKYFLKAALSTSFIILIAYIILSLCWVVTSNRLIAYSSFINLLGSIFLGLGLFISFAKSGFVCNDKLLVGIKLAIALAVIYHILFPSLSVSELEGRYSSIFSTPNNLGQFAALSLIYILFFSRNSITKWFFVFLCLFLLYVCQSYTSIIGVAFCYCLFKIRIKLLLYKKILYLPFIIFFVIIIAFSQGFFRFQTDSSSAIGSRNLTFTGRTTIWELLLKDADKKIINGYGYAGYWGLDKAPSSNLQEEFGLINEGHNGYFDIFASLGIVGYVIFFINIYYLIKNYKFHNINVQYLLILLIFIVLNNFEESSFMEAKHILNIQFLFILFAVNYYNYEKKRLYLSQYTNKQAWVK